MVVIQYNWWNNIYFTHFIGSKTIISHSNNSICYIHSNILPNATHIHINSFIGKMWLWHTSGVPQSSLYKKSVIKKSLFSGTDCPTTSTLGSMFACTWINLNIALLTLSRGYCKIGVIERHANHTQLICDDVNERKYNFSSS